MGRPRKTHLPAAIYQDDLSPDEERRIASWYNTLSDSYDELYANEQAAKHDLVLEILKDTRFRTLVDVGSGTGTFLQRDKDSYEYGVGIDASIRMLQQAKKMKPANTELILASSPKLPIRTGSIDCAVSISTAKHDEKVLEFVDEMERIGGKGSVRIVTILESSERPKTSLPERWTGTQISGRETLYVLGRTDT